MSDEKRPWDIEPERVENEVTDVEKEHVDDDVRLQEPWDPSLIRVDPKQYSLRQIDDMINDKELDLDPDFQRHRVWGPRQKSHLVESVLLRIPLPAFYFSADEEGRMQVVDGLQRLSTIHDFLNDRFALAELEYLGKELAGKRFSDIKQTVWGRRIQGTQIYANVIDPQTPAKVKFDIFKRINTLGEPLSFQEIRHCMSQGTSREFLKTLANSEVFLKATDSSFKEHKRMADREAVLRFCAFRMLEHIEDYAKYESMDLFLTEATDKIDRVLTDADRAQLAADLARAMENATQLFGNFAFRKWPAGQDDRKNPINKPLLEAWGAVLATYAWENLEPHKSKIVDAARRAMAEDREFTEAISVGTGDPRKVKARFDRVSLILNTALQ
jgi:hypothetical protein